MKLFSYFLEGDHHDAIMKERIGSESDNDEFKANFESESSDTSTDIELGNITSAQPNKSKLKKKKANPTFLEKNVRQMKPNQKKNPKMVNTSQGKAKKG